MKIDWQLIGTELEKIYWESNDVEQHVIDILYKRWVSKRACVVSRKKPVQVHHARDVKNAGIGMKPVDIYCVPLHIDYHTGKYGVHTLGLHEFMERFHINFNDVLMALHAEFLEQVLKPALNKTREAV